MFKNKRNYLLLLIPVFVVFIYILSRGTYAIDTLTRSDAKQALVNTAYAFKYRGASFQYDDSKMTYNNSDKMIPRNDLYITPEDITPQDIKYSSCSPFLFNIYNNTFTKTDNTDSYEIGYYNKSGEYVKSINSNHFTLMANPYYNASNNNYANSYYDSEIAVYNIAVKKLNSGTGYLGQIVYSGEVSGYHGFSRTISTYEYTDGTLEKDKFAIVENMPSKSESVVTIENYSDADDFRHQLAQYIIDKLIDYVEVGDIIGYIYDDGNNSHVVMVTAIDKEKRTMIVMHSFNGSSYNYATKKDVIGKNGTVAIWNATDLKTGVNYGFYRKDLAQVSIIRPLNRILNGEYKLSNNSVSRKDYPHLVMTKTSSVNKYESINLNQTITYTIELKNASSADTYTGINISDVVSNNTSYIKCSNNCNVNDNNITWNNITINPGETKNYSYTLKVNNNPNLLGQFIINDDTVVNGIKLNKIETQINKTLTKTMQEELINKVHEMNGRDVGSGYYGRHFIQEVYDSIGLSGFDFNNHTAYQILKMFYTIDKVNIAPGSTINGRISAIDSGEKNRYTLKSTFDNNDSVYTNMLVKGLFGGIYVDREDYEASDTILAAKLGVDGRNKAFRNETLLVGDVLILHDDDYVAETTGTDNPIPVYNVEAFNAYLYLGNGEFATIVKNADNKYVVSISENTTNENPSRLIHSLLGQNAFVILRPSYSMEEDIIISDGDVNLDGIVDTNDAVILVKYILDGNSEYDVNQLLLGDINNDGIIKMNDVMMILREIINRVS